MGIPNSRQAPRPSSKDPATPAAASLANDGSTSRFRSCSRERRPGTVLGHNHRVAVHRLARSDESPEG